MINPRQICLPLPFLFSLTACVPFPQWECIDSSCAEGSTSGDTSATSTSTADSPIHTATGGPATADPSPTTSGSPDDPLVMPAIESVDLSPDPLMLAGAIEVDVVASDVEGVRLEYPGAEVELAQGPDGHYRGAIEVSTGLSNGTYEVTLVPWHGAIEGEPEIRSYTVELPAAGELFLWDTMPDHGLGQIEALQVTASGHVVGFGTLYENGSPRCFFHRRDLEGKYAQADDIRVVFPGEECVAIDLAASGDELYLLMSMKGGDWRWRAAVTTWGEDPTLVRTGAEGEVAYALARSPAGQTAICGTAPSPFMIEDTIDGRVWPLLGAPVKLDYVPPNDPQQQEHMFDETMRDCAFAGERLIAVGDVFGRHEEGNPPPPKRTRPLLLELNGQNELMWHVAGLGPGNTTQGSISELAIDGGGRYVTGLHTCGDACEQQGEVRVYEPGGKIWWQVTLGANVSPPRDIAWSPAGYLVIASAEVVGPGSSKFLLQAFTPAPGAYEPAWSFAKAEVASIHFAHAVAVGRGAVVGAGVGGAGFPILAFLRP